MATNVAPPAAPSSATVPANPPFAAGSFIWRKFGPLPAWAYALVLILVVLVVMYLRRNKAAAQSATALSGSSGQPANQNAPPVFILPQVGPTGPTGGVGPAGPAGSAGPAGPPATVPEQPPGSGRTTAPATNPWINADGTMSVPAGANLYDASDSAGLTGPSGHAQFAALNQTIWNSNTSWIHTPDASGHNPWPQAVRGMPYRVS